MAKKAVAKAQESAVPAYMEEHLVNDAGLGNENLTMQDVGIPFIDILQSGSPQVKRSSGEYMEGAEEGMIFNNVTRTVRDGTKGIDVIPCFYHRLLVEWIDRDQGGGLVAQHPIDDPIRLQASLVERPGGGKQLVLTNGHLLVETAYHYVLVESEGGFWEQAVMSMKSTKLKTSRRWNALISGLRVEVGDQRINPPRFGQKFHFTTVPDNRQNQDFFSWDVNYVGLVDDPETYMQGRDFRELCASGNVRVSQETVDDGESTSSTASDINDDDIPL